MENIVLISSNSYIFKGTVKEITQEIEKKYPFMKQVN